MKQQVAVIGLGRFGSAVAIELVHMGHEVLGIDQDHDVVQHLEDQLSYVVQAEATDEETLERLGVSHFDAAVVGITTSLETSILTTMALKKLGVKRVIVKASNEMHGTILERIGADRVVYPERDTGQRLAHAWTSAAITDSLDVIEGYMISRVEVPEVLVNKTLGEAITRSAQGMTLLLVTRNQRVMLAPPTDFRLQRGDVMVMGGEHAALDRFFSSLQQ